ncbi:MAG: RNA-binding protein [Elusimicrobia bacterium]|nr:RNA-binding protein [Elusimicrobiota bacterium]
MGKRLFVGNLAYDATEAQIKEPFAALGKVVSVRLIMDRETGRFKGFAFVEMSMDAEAAAAITQLNNSLVAGRKMIVSEARPMGERPAPRPGGGPGGPPRGPGSGPPRGPGGGGFAPPPMGRDFGDRGRGGRGRNVKPEWEKKREEREREAAENKRKERGRERKFQEIDTDDGEEFD